MVFILNESLQVQFLKWKNIMSPSICNKKRHVDMGQF